MNDKRDWIPLTCLLVIMMLGPLYYFTSTPVSKVTFRQRLGNPPTDDPGNGSVPMNRPANETEVIKNFTIMTTNRKARMAIIIQVEPFTTYRGDE